MGTGHSKRELGKKPPSQWDIPTGHWATLKAGSASQQTGPAVGNEWALYECVLTSPSHSLGKNGGKSSSGNVYPCKFYLLLQKAQGRAMKFNFNLPLQKLPNLLTYFNPLIERYPYNNNKKKNRNYSEEEKLKRNKIPLNRTYF